MEATGAMGSQTSPYPAANVLNCYNNMAAGWQRYTVTNRANGAGQIEIRLHFNKFASIGSFVNNYWEYRNLNAFFDHVALMPVGQTEYAPQPTILSCIRSGPDIELTWASVMNNIYRLQYCKDLANPSSWPWVTWSPKLDTNLYATGPTCTFQTNLLCLFSFDPTFGPDDPLFFRIYSRGYQP